MRQADIWGPRKNRDFYADPKYTGGAAADTVN